MKTEFKREMNRNYMILHPEKEAGESYTLRMLEANRIAGLLPFQEKRIDGESFLYFDITSKQSLSRMMEYRSFTVKEIRQITEDLVMTMTSLEKFLMDGDQLALEPDLIYVNPDDFKANFCLIPGMTGSFEINFRKFARYILDHVDHTDGEAVILAFALFKAGEKENLGVTDLEQCLQYEGNNGGTSEKTQNEEEKILGRHSDGKERSRVENRTREQETPEMGFRCSEEIFPESGKVQEKNLKTILLLLLGLPIPVIPAAMFFIGGIELVFQWKWMILISWGILLAGAILTGTKSEKKSESEEEEDWEVMFREEEELERGGIPEPDSLEQRKSLWKNDPGPEKLELYREEKHDREEDDEMHTVLLTGRQIYPVTRRLVPENGGEDILIGYFPFIIGKNREISDLCLNLPQISRIHAKIEESGEEYQITDLNSTNGTSVNGCTLETNESARLKPGDSVAFADQRYRFM